nr:immunoglobulin light chain junction region [Macaca mulatta]
CQQDFGYPYTF